MGRVGERTPAEEIVVLEGFGVQEVFCNDTIVEIAPEVVIIIMYRERVRCDLVERHEVARCIMSRADYDANLRRAYRRWTTGTH